MLLLITYINNSHYDLETDCSDKGGAGKTGKEKVSAVCWTKAF